MSLDPKCIYELDLIEECLRRGEVTESFADEERKLAMESYRKRQEEKS
jgi:hypothetical protein